MGTEFKIFATPYPPTYPTDYFSFSLGHPFKSPHLQNTKERKVPWPPPRYRFIEATRQS
jgi:hypothetical protein